MRLPVPSTGAIRFVVKPLLWAVLLAPAAWLAWGVWLALQGDASMLGTDPAETLVHTSGETALRVLLATLAVGVCKDLLGMAWLVRVRRLLGLFAFAWALTHLTTYVVFELEGSLAKLVEDLSERPFIIAGAAALLLLLPLAVTSTAAWQRRLGRRWKHLHRFVYLAAAAACVHLLWQARSDVGEALFYIAAFGLVIGQRLHSPIRRALRARARGRSADGDGGLRAS